MNRDSPLADVAQPLRARLIAYYEGELYNLIRQGRGVPAVPLVLIGVAP